LRIRTSKVIIVARRRAAVRSNVTPLSSRKERQFSDNASDPNVHSTHSSYLQENLFTDKRVWEQEFHQEIFELAALSSVVVATFWIGRVGGHVVNKISDESKHMIIKALLRRSAASRAPLDFHVSVVMGPQSRGDVDYATTSVCPLGIPGHRVALGVFPIIIVIIGRHTTYAVAGVQAMGTVLTARHSRLTAFDSFLGRIPVATARGALVPMSTDVSCHWEKDKERL
jgi:hypothetical protein